MTLTNYLGTGSVSRGKLSINNQLRTIVSQSPYLNNAADKAAVVASIQSLRDSLSKVSGIQWVRPTASQATDAFVNSVRPEHSFSRDTADNPDPRQPRIPQLQPLDRNR